MDENTGGGVPQFATAEYVGASSPDCKACNQRISGKYFQINGMPVCPACAEKIKAQFPSDSHAAFLRGLLFGIGGAAAGLALYVAFALGTGLVAGIVSLAVGWIVGKAIILGSGGVRGRRYQIVAVILTYAAVSLAAVPIALSQHAKRSTEVARTAAATPGGDSAQSAPPASRDLLGSISVLAALGLASPFLALGDPAHGVIGLIILFVGLRIAWQLTAGRALNVVGPLNAAAPPAV